MSLSLRVHASENMPADWPAVSHSSEIDYGYVDIDGKQFLMALHAEARTVWRDGRQFRSVTDFSNYHMFSAETTIRFERQ
jgi:hypothetical protein